ncbi:hypothetical protein ACROYT_G035853 [Oculina patagonica]
MAVPAYDLSVVKESCAQLGEGPHWDETTQRLIWVDILGQSVHLLDPATGKDVKYNFDGPVGAAVPRIRGGCLLVAANRDLIFLDLETGQKEVIASVEKDKPGNRFNDGKCDPAGRFWAGTMGPEPVASYVIPEQGTLYSLDCNHTVHSWFDKISVSNGIAWTTDKKTFYHVDSFESRIDAFDYDDTRGAISNRRNVLKIDLSLGFPDGMTIDKDGMLWVARFNPYTGEYLSQIDLPVSKVTSCCWAGKNYDELIVTSERARLSPEEKQQQPLAGSLFRVKNLGTRGIQAVPFNG